MWFFFFCLSACVQCVCVCAHTTSKEKTQKHVKHLPTSVLSPNSNQIKKKAIDKFRSIFQKWMRTSLFPMQKKCKEEEINANQYVLDQHILKQNVPLYLKIWEPWIFNRERKEWFCQCVKQVPGKLKFCCLLLASLLGKQNESFRERRGRR